jgi:hypothetical protein
MFTSVNRRFNLYGTSIVHFSYTGIYLVPMKVKFLTSIPLTDRVILQVRGKLFVLRFSFPRIVRLGVLLL